MDRAPIAVEQSTLFPNVSCSHCGQDFGPGAHGFSHCENHRGLVPVTVFGRTIEQLRAARAELHRDNLLDDLKQASRRERETAAELQATQKAFADATNAWINTHTQAAYATYTTTRQAWRDADTAYERARCATQAASRAFRAAGGAESSTVAWSDIDVIGQLGGQLRD